jgi:hypothetical protein
MPVKPPPVVAPDSRGKSSERFSRVSAHAKDTVRRVRAYLRGLDSADLESLTSEAKTLTMNEWGSAFPKQRNKGRLCFCDPISLEQVADARPDPFETTYRQELVTLLESRLLPDQVPYLNAFLADEKPRDIAPRLGITTKAASARLRRSRAKFAEIYWSLKPRLENLADRS